MLANLDRFSHSGAPKKKQARRYGKPGKPQKEVELDVNRVMRLSKCVAYIPILRVHFSELPLENSLRLTGDSRVIDSKTSS